MRLYYSIQTLFMSLEMQIFLIGLWGKALTSCNTMMSGRIVEEFMILPLREGSVKSKMLAFMKNNLYFSSYLKELVPVYNKVAKSVLEEKMKGSADGKTVVDVKEVFDRVAFQIISQVFSSNY